jgi:hypothetical protein
MRRTRKILCLAAPVGALALMGCQRTETATAERVDHADVTYEAAPTPEQEAVPASADVTPAPSEPRVATPTVSTAVVATPRTDKDGRPACGNVMQKGRPRECN